MAIWLEFRCDNRVHSIPDPGTGADCASNLGGRSPMTLTDNDMASIHLGLRDMRAEAKDIGWTRRNGQWLCPFCRAALKKETE